MQQGRAVAPARPATRVRSMWSMHGPHRILHLTWPAFFLSFVAWFGFAPLATTIGDALVLDREQLAAVALANIALTVPARVLIGMALDRWGPRRTFAAVLMYAAVPSLVCAAATSFEQLLAARLAMSVVGAGFVVGVRMIGEWFPSHEIGLAEGIYGGWGNAGSAAAALTLPALAAALGGEHGWRLAIATTGVLAFGYGLYYLRAVSDTPDGCSYDRPARQGALEVTSPAAVAGLLALNAPLIAILGVVTWQLRDVGVLSGAATWAALAALAAVLMAHSRSILRVNDPAVRDAHHPDDRYEFRSVALLCAAYFVTFGSELAVISMLPAFFESTFGASVVAAGLLGSAFAATNLVARPAGGLLSDLMASRRLALRLLLGALGVGYAMLAGINDAWPLGLAVLVTVLTSLCVQAGEGAVYAMVPLVRRSLGGQIAGIVGAYGILGGMTFLTVLSAVGTRAFFTVMALCAAAVAVICRWLPQPDVGATPPVTAPAMHRSARP